MQLDDEKVDFEGFRKVLCVQITRHDQGMSVNILSLISGVCEEKSFGLKPGTCLWPKIKEAFVSQKKRKCEENRITWGWGMGHQNRDED